MIKVSNLEDYKLLYMQNIFESIVIANLLVSFSLFLENVC